MTNKEKYKQTFDTLSASVNFSLEVDKMSILNRKHKLKTLAAAVAACLIVTVGTGTAYASDLGGIQRNAPYIEYEKDGSVILYYKNQSIDITHKFNKDNICYVKLVDGDDSLYVTVKYNNGYASSPNKYISPWEFN